MVFNEEISKNCFESIVSLKLESVITIKGKVRPRTSDTVNNSIDTGDMEIMVEDITVISEAYVLPMTIAEEQDYPKDIRFKYRFLDLRREKVRKNIILRSQVTTELSKLMIASGFIEIQTPILTASSPEGARDYLMPSRLHPGKFYALPQAPQQFKQILMISGFDKYFQISPCFRDEDARADRSPGEFYQLDLEMSLVSQKDRFNTIEPILYNIFSKFSSKYVCKDFVRIPYKEAMLKYGSDKPDLRNPLIIADVTEIFRDSEFNIFKILLNPIW